MEAPLLNGFARSEEENGDYEAVKSVTEAVAVFKEETMKLWKIAGPLVFNILCQYGSSAITNIFVGHLGDLQLSAVSISTSVIGTFSFGFMVIFSLSGLLKLLIR